MRPRTIPVLVVLLTLAAACGDDDTDTSPRPVTSSTSGDTTSAATEAPATSEASPEGVPAGSIDPSDAEFCAAAEAINNSDAMPTVDDVLAYQAVAPDEIQPQLDLVIATLEAADGDFTAVFADEAAGAALEEITAVERARCGTGDEGPPPDPMVTVIDESATRVDLVASEYAFEGDLPASAGRFSFVMANEGAEPHLMVLVRLEDGFTVEQVLASQGEEGVAEEYQSSPATPGGEGVLTADLGPGTWVLLCPIPGPSGAPHFADGMLEQFSIT